MAYRVLRALPERLVPKAFKGHKALKVPKVVTCNIYISLETKRHLKIGSDGKDGSDGTNGKDGTPGAAGTAGLSKNKIY